ncbi:hypothetical protein NMY22_g6110 [Coprinellus aureogranulatus]|nr:hypothetical protein NMY22_g6110 [Coprinellus aureogranulatus]
MRRPPIECDVAARQTRIASYQPCAHDRLPSNAFFLFLSRSQTCKDTPTPFSPKGKIAVIGSGIEQTKLADLVNKTFPKLCLPPGTPRLCQRCFWRENSIARHVEGSSLIASAIPEGSSTPSVYSRSGVSPLWRPRPGSHRCTLEQAGKVAVDAVKKAANSVSNEVVATAAAKARFAAASAADGRAGVVEAIGAKIFSGSGASNASTLAAFDSDASAFSKDASSLVRVGALPYADELGFRARIVRWRKLHAGVVGREKVKFGDQKDWESTTLNIHPL